MTNFVVYYTKIFYMKSNNIFKISFIIGLMILFFACNNDELNNKINDLEKDKSDLQQGSMAKDEQIDDYIKSLNEIQDNLDSIKSKEHLVTTTFDKGKGEIDNNMKDQIVSDIELINNLLQENKSKMASLNRRLKKSNLKIDELQKMVERLANEIQAKDAEITDLKTQLSQANEQIKVLFEEYNNRLEELGNKEDELNTAYYCYGTSKELRSGNIITKEGGFIGIGRTEKLSKDFNKDYFTKIDISVTNEIPLNVKKVKIITSHPSESYQLVEADGKVEKIVIKDTKAFWATSKYLVIVVEN